MYKEAGTEYLEKVLIYIKYAMQETWSKLGSMGLELVEPAIKELESHREFVEKRIIGNMGAGFHDKHIQKLKLEIDSYMKDAEETLKNAFNCVVVGVPLDIEITKIENKGDTNIFHASAVVGSNVGGDVVQTTIEGDLHQTINNINQKDPELSKNLKDLLEVFEKTYKDTDSRKYEEAVEHISTISEEATKPKARRKRNTLNNAMERLTKMAATIKGGETVVNFIVNTIKAIGDYFS